VRSIAALLRAYDLEPGDRLYVDTGNYAPPANIVITNEDSGVTIQGPWARDTGFVRRGNRSLSNARVFDLENANNITLSYLSVTGAYDGIYVASGSTGFRLEHSYRLKTTTPA